MSAEMRRVELTDVPVELYWEMEKQHAAMLREFALIAIGLDNPEVSDPPAQLVELIRDLRSRYGRQRSLAKQQLQDALHERLETVTVRLELPAQAALEVESALAAYEQADEFCRTGDLLTLASPPDVAAFRRRLFQGVAEQLRRP